MITDKKNEVIANHVHEQTCQKIWERNKGDQSACRDKDLVVVIKPNEDATYKNSVDILDEMQINDIKRFALVDITSDENMLVKATEVRNGVK